VASPTHDASPFDGPDDPQPARLIGDTIRTGTTNARGKEIVVRFMGNDRAGGHGAGFGIAARPSMPAAPAIRSSLSTTRSEMSSGPRRSRKRASDLLLVVLALGLLALAVSVVMCLSARAPGYD
jgi:hypothetical protein